MSGRQVKSFRARTASIGQGGWSARQASARLVRITTDGLARRASGTHRRGSCMLRSQSLFAKSQSCQYAFGLMFGKFVSDEWLR